MQEERNGITLTILQEKGGCGIDADAKADGNGIGKILDGEHQT